MNGVGVLFSPYVCKRREAKLDAPLTAYHDLFHTTVRTTPPSWLRVGIPALLLNILLPLQM